jgi:hypothetical protein
VLDKIMGQTEIKLAAYESQGTVAGNRKILKEEFVDQTAFNFCTQLNGAG